MPKPVYALVGEDSFLQLEALAAVLTELPADVQRIDADGERTELAEVLDDLRSFAMFGGGKLVVVRDADAFVTRFRSSLEDYLAQPSSSGTLVLRCKTLAKNTRVYKLIDKAGGVVPCEPPKEKDVPGWVLKRARSAHGLTVSLDASNLLADLIGNDLGRLDNELAKLALRVENGKVEAGDISGTVAFQREQEMWSFTDALTSGDTTEAVRRWRHLVQLDSSAEFRAVTWLGIWLENVRKALAMRRKRVPDAAIAKACRIWDFKQQRPFFRTVENLGDAGVARAINLLADVDRRTKSGLGDAAANVERFVLSLQQR